MFYLWSRTKKNNSILHQLRLFLGFLWLLQIENMTEQVKFWRKKNPSELV